MNVIEEISQVSTPVSVREGNNGMNRVQCESQEVQPGEIAQGSEGDDRDGRGEGEVYALLSFSFDEIDHRIRMARARSPYPSEAGPALYPRPPAEIRLAWSVLAPAIFELTEHVNPKQTLMQTMRQISHARTSVKKSATATGELSRSEACYVQNWLNGIFILMGTVPIDMGDVSKAESVRMAMKIADGEKASRDGGLSSQSRVEMQSCLELLCARLWKKRYVEDLSLREVQEFLYHALQYFYWECSVPHDVALLWDELPDVTDEIFTPVRAVTYQQIHELAHAKRLMPFLQIVQAGTMALAHHRYFHRTIYLARRRRDERGELAFDALVESIKEKYRRLSPEEDENLGDTSLGAEGESGLEVE